MRNFKKIVQKIFNRIFIYLFVIFIPIIFFLKKKNYFLVEIHTLRIGSLAGALEPFIIQLKKERLNTSKKKYLIIYSKKITNKFLLNISLRELKEFKNLYFLIGYNFWRYLNLSYEFWTKKKDFKYILGGRHNYHVFKNSKKIIKFNQDEENQGKKLLEKLGVPNSAKWICIHNRDDEYLNKVYPDVNWDYHNYRNFPIEDLKMASEYFTEKGYYVIRVGNHAKEKINTKNPKIIDYSFSKYCSDFSDVFLLANCAFYFGSPSGIVNLALLFRRPLFVVNMVPMEAIFSYEREFPCIFMKMMDVKNNQILSVRDMVKIDLLHTFRTSEFIAKGIKPVNNTPKEILDFAIEAEKRVTSQWYNSDGEFFKKLSNSFAKEIYQDNLIKNMFYKNPIGYEFLKSTKVN